MTVQWPVSAALRAQARLPSRGTCKTADSAKKKTPPSPPYEIGEKTGEQATAVTSVKAAGLHVVSIRRVLNGEALSRSLPSY